jgi:hypothetical protein
MVKTRLEPIQQTFRCSKLERFETRKMTKMLGIYNGMKHVTFSTHIGSQFYSQMLD